MSLSWIAKSASRHAVEKVAMRHVRSAFLAALVVAAVSVAALAVLISTVRYRGWLGPRQTERLLLDGTQTRSVRCDSEVG